MSDKANRGTTISLSGAWFAGWLFTIGAVHLGVGQAVLGLVTWPYYIGSHFFG